MKENKTPTSLKKNALKTWGTTLSAVALTTLPTFARNDLTWSEAGNDGSTVSTWIRSVMLVIMAIFIMIAIVTGSLAFKQLAADGNWKDFWSKIAGSIGMFVVPIVIYYLVDLP